MAAMNEIQALTTSIGEYAVSMIGKEKLAALQVTVNPRELTAFMSISLRDGSDEGQREAIKAMFDVESVFADDAAITYVFVNEISDEVSATAAALYSYA